MELADSQSLMKGALLRLSMGTFSNRCLGCKKKGPMLDARFSHIPLQVLLLLSAPK
jgi:hypothetical protein